MSNYSNSENKFLHAVQKRMATVVYKKDRRPEIKKLEEGIKTIEKQIATLEQLMLKKKQRLAQALKNNA
jgi:chaperonin cofactor prefoldin